MGDLLTPVPSLSVSKDSPGIFTLRLGIEKITINFSDRPRSAMALLALANAIEIEEQNAREGLPDMTKWIGAFNIPTERDNDW